MYVLTTNDKTVKLWKISDKNIKKIIKPSGKELGMPKLQTVESGLIPSIRKIFPNLHNYHINSLSLAQNEEFVLTSDDLKVILVLQALSLGVHMEHRAAEQSLH